MTPTPPAGADDAAAFARMLESLRTTVAALADEVRHLDAGWVARTRSLPRVWTLNQVCITEEVDVADVVSITEAQQGDLPYRHAKVEHATTGRMLERALAVAGWDTDREVFMLLDAAAGGTAPAGASGTVSELDEDEMVGVMRRWLAEERPGTTPQDLDEVAEYNRREGRLWGEVCLGVRDGAGRPVAITKLRRRDAVAWIEDVYTVPEARGRGHARALVSQAARLARDGQPELAFIVADDNDWPKELYASIGFRPAGTTRTFHLDVDAFLGAAEPPA